MASIFHQWHNLNLTLTLQPAEIADISITCRQGDPETQRWKFIKIPFHKSEEKAPSAGDNTKPAPGFSEEETKQCYATLRLKPCRSLLAPATQEE